MRCRLIDYTKELVLGTSTVCFFRYFTEPLTVQTSLTSNLLIVLKKCKSRQDLYLGLYLGGWRLASASADTHEAKPHLFELLLRLHHRATEQSEESDVCPLPHSWAQRGLWLVTATLTDRGETVTASLPPFQGAHSMLLPWTCNHSATIMLVPLRSHIVLFYHNIAILWGRIRAIIG